MKASKPQNVKENNLMFLKTVIKENGPLSQREIAKQSGLSIVTINKLVTWLLERDEIKEAKKLVTTGGRRAVSYEYNAEFKLLLAIQLIEKNHKFVFLFHVTDLFGEIVSEEEISGSSLSWAGFKEYVSSFLDKFPKIGGIMLGIPGVEIHGELKILDFPPLLNLNVRKELQEVFHLPVGIENDINTAVRGYADWLPVKHEILVGIYYPDDFPPGASILINGKIFKGRNGLAGEIKHLPLSVDWEMGLLDKIEFNKNSQEVIQTIISMYDPDKIIIYTNERIVSQEELVPIKENLAEVFPYIELPEIASSVRFSQDYLKGLIIQGIELIELAE
ncbi:ROK family protein [Carnobacterium divergens]|uniref:Transcriptional regulator sugar kinase, xylose operon regulator n=1 Tax=Carnobacterium divergens DSM 20623 TaxID=1449336 RepID=A0A0R2I3T5_CARDV|nr:ROK family protein [Carnobacterium divergens]KRN56458.1 transcriptional regulator sugar kinase, xylose operon regulator [Carnobacterium divergens DSM 20623]MDO0874949.1 ROK family protein [Carnobacterium divergens]SUX17726.1 D-allose kinase [Carnobacterium divergens]